jgi:chemotaxis protein methyltransferase CheR
MIDPARMPKGLGILPGGALLRRTKAWKRLRHWISVRVDGRHNSHFTGFLRLPTQFGLLAGPVVAHLQTDHRHAAPFRICVLGCSKGAEAFTIASVLTRHHPEMAFQVRGYDIDCASIEKARLARYEPDEVFNIEVITHDFVRTTFDRDGDTYVIKPHIAARVQFDVADVLSPDLPLTVGDCHIVFLQNVLVNLRPGLARRVFDNALRLLRPGSVLFADGVDLDMRQKTVLHRGLVPVDYEIERIHNEARRARSAGWPYHYWGLEPFMTYRKNWKSRYATVFVAP